MFLRNNRLGWFVLLIAAGWISQLQAAEPSGNELYKQHCVRCHGAQGEGSPKRAEKLTGELSLGQLTTIIHETMPEDNPGTLNEAQAKAVAQYVHETFYSAIAQERNRAARIELSRLTVRQYRQSVADLIGSFRAPAKWGTEPGLKALYFKSSNQRDQVAERIDPHIHFQFEDQAPIPDKMDPFEFSIKWRGSLLVPETGDYEFVIRTEHAAVLFLNDDRVPLIDALIKSGDNTEFRAHAYLLAGRPYYLRVEYNKGKTGVNDPKLNKKGPKPAKSSMTLLWKRPNHPLEVIDTRYFSTQNVSEQFAISTPFPPDDRSYGWERGTTISKEWDNATTEAAIETARYILKKVDDLASTKHDASDRTDKLKAFAKKFAERAFRSPLSNEETSLLIDKQFAENTNPDEAVLRVVILTLKSPRFLYREIGEQNEAYRRATRLSYALWDSLPDEELRKAAANDQLKTAEQLRPHAERLLRDAKAQTKLREFLLSWLKADHGLDLAKDQTLYPGFDAQLIADLRTSLELTLDKHLRSEASDYRQLVSSTEYQINGRIAKFYGLDLPADAPFQSINFEPERRAGILTHPYLMTSFAHNKESSPIHRGVFLARGVLGVALKAPPEAIAPTPPDLQPDLTTRERVAIQTKAAICMTCHGIINPLGFTLENYDAAGRFRDQEDGKPINAQGSYRTAKGDLVKLADARELTKFVVKSDEAHEAFVEQLFHHMIKQSILAYGPETLDKLERKFAQQEFSIRRLAMEIAILAAMQELPPPQFSASK
jgi:cytochrome c553